MVPKMVVACGTVVPTMIASDGMTLENSHLVVASDNRLVSVPFVVRKVLDCYHMVVKNLPRNFLTPPFLDSYIVQR